MDNNARMQFTQLTLAFTGQHAHLEAPFLHDYYTRFIRHIRACHFYTMAAWGVWMAMTAALYPELRLLATLLVVAVVWPVFMASFIFSFHKRFINFYQAAMASYIVLVGLCALYITMVGATPFFESGVMGFSFCFVFGYMLIRARFIYAATASIFITVVFIATISFFKDISLSSKMFSSAFLLLLNSLGAIACYNLERSARRDFFFAQLLLHKQKELENANNSLTKLNTSLEMLSLQDSLTGVGNRRCFDECLDKEWQRLSRSEQPLSLILVDVDHFKLYNDTFGHQAGDGCLQELARILQKQTQRSNDMAFRYGGEEFALVLPETNEAGAARVAQAIRDAVRALNLPHESSPTAPHVTVSLGAATMTPQPQFTPADLVAATDQALYLAKKQGRDQYVRADTAGA
ncbi:MAG: GGDEF domain-containing protein [Desulfovibrio sp.]|nr:MAG: GGDEF domain-containing protein [Desulfovibrio sp.]